MNFSGVPAMFAEPSIMPHRCMVAPIHLFCLRARAYLDVHGESGAVRGHNFLDDGHGLRFLDVGEQDFGAAGGKEGS